MRVMSFMLCVVFAGALVYTWREWRRTREFRVLSGAETVDPYPDDSPELSEVFEKLSDVDVVE